MYCDSKKSFQQTIHKVWGSKGHESLSKSQLFANDVREEDAVPQSHFPKEACFGPSFQTEYLFLP